VSDDLKVLEKCKFDIYANPEIFLKKIEAEAELNKRLLSSEFEKLKVACKISSDFTFDYISL
ncbi:unnamed protein product, partial [Rotaria socialis]